MYRTTPLASPPLEDVYQYLQHPGISAIEATTLKHTAEPPACCGFDWMVQRVVLEGLGHCRFIVRISFCFVLYGFRVVQESLLPASSR